MAETDEKDAELSKLREENQRLHAELDRLQSGVRFATMATCGGTGLTLTGARTGQTTGTVVGVEEMVLQVGSDRTIGYLNAPMAKLLGVKDRKEILGKPLSAHDRGPVGEGTLVSVVEAALASPETVVIERVCPGLPESLLPAASGKRPACPPILRFAATAVKGRVEVIAQDVTRLRWLESTFARYVAPEVIEQMLRRSEADYLQMERREITVLFADLRGFTRITQQLEPRVLQEMINEFLSTMVACIGRFGGTVDKFVGDEVMALFGAPVPTPDHALRGLLTALEMQARHRELMQRWEGQGRPPSGLGVGLNTGEAIVGNVGTPARMEFSALGHTVNLAARLCAKAEAGEILTVGATYQGAAAALETTRLAAIPRFKFSPRGQQSFKNVEEPVTVLAVSIP